MYLLSDNSCYGDSLGNPWLQVEQLSAAREVLLTQPALLLVRRIYPFNLQPMDAHEVKAERKRQCHFAGEP